MAEKRLGAQTVYLANPPSIAAYASIVGKKEGEGPLGQYFDKVIEDDLWGEKSWEKAECKMFEEVSKLAIQKSGKNQSDIHYLLGGDLLNQIIASSFAARSIGIPFFGLYGACSTMSEALGIGALLIDGGFADNVLCTVSSHFSTAERQYRFPLELGSQRPPTAQWTVTGAGASFLSSQGNGPYITLVTIGRVIDLGIKDANNMGAAMAPAAVDTLITHFKDTNQRPEDYDLIVTGDLGRIGKEITYDLTKKQGYDLGNRLFDCGCEIFSENQDAHAGGSGCGCSASVLNSYILNKINEGIYRKVLFMATGALLSTTSSQQGESIPSIAHAITIQKERS
ncbi:MAG: stage V sporulation protein AD [Clostridia bacterium]|jgi:stage V sporulation protein AD